MRTKKNTRHQAGFSLVEIMIATLILSVVVAGVSSSFIQAIRYVQPQRPFVSDMTQTLNDVFNLSVVPGWNNGLWPLADGPMSGDNLPLVPDILNATVHGNIDGTIGAPNNGMAYKKVTEIISWPA